MADQSSETQVTGKDIVTGLRQLGLERGMGIVVHSSLKSFGHVEGGAQTVIQALMETLTTEGTLLMPCFSHHTSFIKDGKGHFDPLNTPTSNGKIPDTFRRMPGVFRSLNPTHSFCAWGKNAESFTRFHHRTLTLGPKSPLGLLWKQGGYGLLVGVTYHPNTFHHVVEVTTGAPCLALRSTKHDMKLPDGRIVESRTWGFREKSCPLTDHALYSSEMADRGLHRQVIIGKSTLTQYKLQDCFDVISSMLRTGRDGDPPCCACSIRPKKNEFTVPSDWDDESNSLMPYSPALEY